MLTRGHLAGFVGGLLVAGAAFIAFLLGESRGEPVSEASSPPIAVDEAPSTETLPSEAEPRTATPGDRSIDAVSLAPPLDSCVAYAPGHGSGRIYLRGLLLVKSPPGAVVTLVMHLPEGPMVATAISDENGTILFDVDLRRYADTGISTDFKIISEVSAEVGVDTYRCGTTFCAGGYDR